MNKLTSDTGWVKVKPKTPATIERMDKKPWYPSFYIDLKNLPQAKNWDVGKNYTVSLKLTMTGLSINKGMGEEKGSVDFDIKSIKV